MFAQTHHNIDPLSLILTSERKVSSEKFLLFKATHTGMRCGLLSLSGCCCSTSIEKLQVLISLCEAALILFGTSNTVIPKDHIVHYVNYNQRHILRLIQHLFFWINLHGWPNALKGLENIFSVFNIWMIHTQDLSHGLIGKIKLCLSHASLLISVLYMSVSMKGTEVMTHVASRQAPSSRGLLMQLCSVGKDRDNLHVSRCI